MNKGGYVYILTNKNNNVLYVGSTEVLVERKKQHERKKAVNSFTARYNINKLVYYRWFPTIQEARLEEKRIKGGNRQKKLDLINGMNPEWKELSDQVTKG